MHYVAWSKLSSSNDILRHLTGTPSAFHHHQRFDSSFLIETKDSQGRSMLHLATQRGNMPLIQFLLSQPRAHTLMMPDHWGRTLLHYATESSRSTHVIDYFLEKKFDIHATDNSGRTVLHHAAMSGNLKAVQHLLTLDVGYQLASFDHDHRTPLDLARLLQADEVTKYLLPLYQWQEQGSPMETKSSWVWKVCSQRMIEFVGEIRHFLSRYVLRSNSCIILVAVLLLYLRFFFY